MDLLQHHAQKTQIGQPLAERMRPGSLDAFFGQHHLLGDGKFLTQSIRTGQLPSLLFWGPPGSGKTTLARILSNQVGAAFSPLSAVSAGVKELREIVERARTDRDHFGKRTVLFIDEIHRFNKSQQDALLPHVEIGVITFIGATTENPSFEVVAPLLSRCRVLRLEPLDADDLMAILRRAMASDKVLAPRAMEVSEEVLRQIIQTSDGDARRALTTLEVAVSLASTPVLTVEHVEQAMQQRMLRYDATGEEHYNVVSAFIKSLRGSDPDAAVYWMVRMLEAGEDPIFILRRMIIFASEDIGNADPTALCLTVSALEAVRAIGLPEATLTMTQAATYLATAPKCNTALTTYARARKDVMQHGPLPVPLRLRNAPTRLMQDMGYGKGYRYPHNYAGNYVSERYLPDALLGRQYYFPSTSGYEAILSERLKHRD